MGDYCKFCDLLRKPELYKMSSIVEYSSVFWICGISSWKKNFEIQFSTNVHTFEFHRLLLRLKKNNRWFFCGMLTENNTVIIEIQKHIWTTLDQIGYLFNFLFKGHHFVRITEMHIWNVPKVRSFALIVSWRNWTR